MSANPITYTPTNSYESALAAACKLWGIQPEYWDIFGKKHKAPAEVQAAVLRSMGVNADSTESLNRTFEEQAWAEWASPIPKTLVLSVSDGFIPVRLPADVETIQATFIWENGQSRTTPFDAVLPVAEARLREQNFKEYRLPLPAEAKLGYHRLKIGNAEAELILCPDRAHAVNARSAGIAVSVYGLKSDRNWGCGDFTDVQHFTKWANQSLGVAFVALNPLHSIPNRQPYNTSPYLPNCSFYRNGIYIDIERIPEIQRSSLAQRLLSSPKLRACLEELRSSAYVEYEKVWRLKRVFLKLAYRQFLRDNPPGSPVRKHFDDYAWLEGELLHKFAVYQALDEWLHKQDGNLWIWPDWPEAYRNPHSPEVNGFETDHARSVQFYKYIQWVLEQQLADAQQYAKSLGMPIGLYHDLALATDRCGSDLWAHPEHYVAGCRVGSPPDDFSPTGQDWAFPPPNSRHHRETGYKMFIRSIRNNARHGGALRIDHVMRFFRLFWITDGKTPTEGLYVHDYSDDLIRILALESVRGEFVVIGEDLGTVEPYIRKSLGKFGILSYRLLYFERGPGGTFKEPDEYPQLALVSVSTHDLPTLAGFWENRDIEARRRAGVLPDEGSYREQLSARAVEKQRMLDVMFASDLLPPWFPRMAADVPEFTGELHNGAVGFLAETPSQLFVLNQEDLFKDPDQQNLPGTTEQYPNWRHKMRFTISQLSSNAEAVGCALMFRTWLAKTGRLQASE